MKQIFATFPLRNFPWVFALLVSLFANSCAKDPAVDGDLQGDMLRFAVAEEKGWNMHLQRCAAEAEERTAVSSENVAEVFSLRGENPADTLFLHASVADRIATQYPRLQTDRLQTRGMPVERGNFYDSFGVLASVYTGSWSEVSCLPDYMYDVEVTKASSWTTSYYWPGSGRNIRFFAYAPYDGRGIVLSDKTSPGTPSITYTVPVAVADQQDLLVAATSEMAGNTTAAAPLIFAHALTVVRFTTGDDMMAGRITKITLKGVYGSGSHVMGSDSWGSYGAKTDFSQTLAVSVDGSADQEITSGAATFMMVPQTLPAGASIEVVYTDDLTSTQRILTASIAGSQWPMGKFVTYRISTSSISITPTFSVTMPGDFTYAGGSKTYSVASSISVSRPGDDAKVIAMEWSAEFVEEDGSGGYTPIPKPYWVESFATSGIGDASPVVKIGAQSGITVNIHDDALRKATPVSGIYNLSNPTGLSTIMNTANCYVINAPGKYSLPLVYGNAIKNGRTNTSAYTSNASGGIVLTPFVNHLGAGITSPYIYNNPNCNPRWAELLWQDEANLVTNVALSEDKRTLLFEVAAATIRQGNAIVVVRDANAKIMWSWHIWVTDYRLGDDIKTVTNFQGISYKFMPVNIGWCYAEPTNYEARSVKVRFMQTETGDTQVVTLNQLSHTVEISDNSPYFQFGRKDPMLPALSGDQTKTWYNAYGISSTALKTSSWNFGVPCIMEGILNPDKFCINYYMDNMYNNLWSADNTAIGWNDDTVVKTIYDPSPVGYHVPAANAFTGFTTNGLSSLSVTGTWDREERGWNFTCMDAGSQASTVFFRALGYRSPLTGAPGAVSSDGYYWSVSPLSVYGGSSLIFHSSKVDPTASSNRAYGFTVRPVQE